MLDESVEQAIEKARSIKIALSHSMGLSNYLLNNGYLRKTHGGNIPIVHALG